jgi:hypothetical protein
LASGYVRFLCDASLLYGIWIWIWPRPQYFDCSIDVAYRGVGDRCDIDNGIAAGCYVSKPFNHFDQFVRSRIRLTRSLLARELVQHTDQHFALVVYR